MQIWRCDDGLQAKPFFFAATKIRIGRGTRGRNSRCRRNHYPRLLAQTPLGGHGGRSPSLCTAKKRAPHLCERLSAVRTRLELATPGVTGRYSNRLNYRTSPNSLERECKDSDFFRFSNSEDIFFEKYLLCLRLEFNIYESTKKL